MYKASPAWELLIKCRHAYCTAAAAATPVSPKKLRET
jgi:hypothetical protein